MDVPMFRRGEVYENPVTGERAVIRVGTAETSGQRLVVDLFVRPGGRVAAEHYHPNMRERFTIVEGLIGMSADGERSVLARGTRVDVPPGMVHDWWNAGTEVAQVLLEIEPAARFEAAIRNSFGLAQDGRTDARGMPGLLQLALFAREFDDVIRFARPPRVVQRLLFALLAPLARLAGYKGSYPEYLDRPPKERLEPAPSSTPAERRHAVHDRGPVSLGAPLDGYRAAPTTR
jgi:quercetin dioxygenase-like cupin family protein